MRLYIFLSCVFLPSSPALAQIADNYRTITYPSEVGITLGNGWDFARGRKTSSNCVDADTATDRGEDKKLTFKRVIDTESMMQALSVSVEAKASSILGGSASASATFSRSVNTSSEAVNILANAVVLQGATYLVPKGLRATLSALQPMLTGQTAAILSLDTQSTSSAAATPEEISQGISDVLGRSPSLTNDAEFFALTTTRIGGVSIKLRDAAASLARNNLAEFYRQCGDGFVSSIISGGSIEALYTFTSRDRKLREDFAAAMSGSFPGFSASGSVRTALETYTKNVDLKISFHELGGAGDALPLSQEELEQKIKTLPATALSFPRPFQISVVSYRQLPNFPTAAAVGQSEIDKIVTMYWRFDALMSAINPMLQNEQGYVLEYGVSKTSLQNVQDKISRDRDALRAATQSCVSASTCKYPAAVPVSDLEYRSNLPLKKLGFEQDRKLAEARAALSNDQAVYSSLRKCINAGIIRLNDCPEGPPLENPDRINLRNKIASTKVLIGSLEQSRKSDYIAARYMAWVDEPARTRCELGFDQSCVLNSTLNSIRGMMESAANAN